MVKLTDKTYKVAWDSGGDQPDIVLDARLEVDTRGYLKRWNGYVRPRFAKSEVERYVEFSTRENAGGGSYEVVELVDDKIVWIADGESTVYERDEHELFELGGGGWTWQVVGGDPESLVQVIARVAAWSRHDEPFTEKDLYEAVRSTLHEVNPVDGGLPVQARVTVLRGD